jgi:hypothetical protein
MGLQSFYKSENEQRWKSLWRAGGTCLGILLLLYLIKGSFSFSGGSDSYFMQSYGADFINALKDDRKALYSADLLRSGFLILLSAAVLWMFIKGRLSHKTSLIIVGVIMVGDLFFIGKNYLDSESFVSQREVRQPFEATPADLEILKDTTHYRVFEISGNMSSARSSYFHKSIGGYHAAKPVRMQELFDYQIAKNNIEVLNMLNVKYIIQTDKEGNDVPIANPDANGNAWFVKQLKFVPTPDAEINALGNINTKNIAVVNSNEFGKMVSEKNFVTDSLSRIELVSYKPNHLKYITENKNSGVAIFSEIYYPKGWNAYLNGKKSPYFRANYALRAMEIPAGKHTVEFKFEPEVVQTGSLISLISSIGILLLLLSGIYYERKRVLHTLDDNSEKA